MKGKLSPFQYPIQKDGCGMRLFVGLDVSLEKTAICVISENEKIVKEAQAANEPEALLRWIVAQGGSIAVIGLEAGPLSQ
jgi:transposase